MKSLFCASSRFGLTLLIAAVGATAALAQTPTATIHVDMTQDKAPVPPGLYGIFMEEINHGFDGGIYGELIQNRSFEEGVLPPGTEVIARHQVDQNDHQGGMPMLRPLNFPPGVPDDKKQIPWPWGDNAMWKQDRELVGWSFAGSGGAMKLTSENPMNAASSRSLEVTAAKGSAVRLINSGYWGISVKDGTSYNLRFFLRPGTFNGTVTASLESADGKVLASEKIGSVKTGMKWDEHKATLKAKGTDPTARFVLTFDGAGALQVDFVSLFPPTWKNKPNGLRQDLAQYLADMKPAFIRYPGGCYVEGWSWESAPNWETMVKPVEERPGTYAYWKYRSTDGFGYHEFLQFCEDIGSEPLFVVNAGMTVHPLDNVPMDQLQPYIQRALDAIEYANGPITSKWGAVRAKMGHPKPFNLKTIEIGNEHETADYADYYKKFREAIHAKYPDVKVILSMYWAGLNRRVLQRAGDANIDMVDEHAYHNNEWPRQNFDYFDKYNRNVPWKLFVGEYASQERTGNWGGGMGDSLYLMMTERNGDLVKMAAYAPLFVNVKDRTWAYNLIEFDAARSFAHGSYYVQKVFNANRPDVNLATTTDVVAPAATPTPSPTATPAAGGQGRGRGRGRGRGQQPELGWMFAQAGYDNKAGEVILKATNYKPEPVTVSVDLAGAKNVGKTGKIISISNNSLTGDNTLDNPTKIQPKESELTAGAAKFEVTLPGYSVNLLRIPAKK